MDHLVVLLLIALVVVLTSERSMTAVRSGGGSSLRALGRMLAIVRATGRWYVRIAAGR